MTRPECDADDVERAFAIVNDPQHLQALAALMMQHQQPLRAYLTLFVRAYGEDVAASALLGAALAWETLKIDFTKSVSMHALHAAEVCTRERIGDLPPPTDLVGLTHAADRLILKQPYLATTVAVWLWNLAEENNLPKKAVPAALMFVATVAVAALAVREAS